MKTKVLPVLSVLILVLAIALLGTSANRLPSAHAQEGLPPDEPPGETYQPMGQVAPLGSDEEPGAVAPTSEQASPDESKTQALAPEAPLPATTVYFFPDDSNDTSTVLMLLNTNTSTQTVNIQGFTDAGAQYVSCNVNVAAKSSARIISDGLTAGAPSSWANAVLCNFQDGSEYARIMLPRGVKVDGYVVWGTLTEYDPRAKYSMLPLRFSTDPLTTFMPTLEK